MNDKELETRLRARYRARAGESEAAPLALRRDVASIARDATTRRVFGRGRGITLLAAAALLLVGGALAAGSGVLRRPAVVPPVPAPSLVAVAIASPDTTAPSPSKLATVIPSPATWPITWTQASLKQDWPAPVRTEPAGRPILVPILYLKKDVMTCCKADAGHRADPTGDTGSSALPWGDIDNVALYHVGVEIDFVSVPGDSVDPRDLWFAYGVVVDADGDGVPDWRYGVDNVPVGTPSHCDGSNWTSRRWRTDLHTGRTDWMVCYTLIGPSPDGVPPSDPGSAYAIFQRAVGGGYDSATAKLSFSGDTPAGDAGAPMPERFYAWASVIQDGRVVATDYAPDTGWLVPSETAKN